MTDHFQRTPEPHDEDRMLVALALLALNDASGAALALRGMSTPDGADLPAALAAGAWAAWRGEVLPLALLRDAGMRWLAAVPASLPAADDDWSRCALAFGPAAAEACDDPRLLERLRARPGTGLPPLERLALTRCRVAPAAASAGEVLRLMHGTLGVVPDAPRGRVRLGPDVATGSWTLEHLALGDATLSLRVEAREVGSVAITVDQTAGAMPLTAILEPRVPARRLRQVEVDGRPATLDARQDGDGLRVSVQLVIDQPRSLTIDFE